MKKYTGLVLAVVLNNNALALDKVTENVQAVCLAPSQQGKYWTVTAKGGLEANGLIRLIAAGINGEATFTKGEWDGVQQVLKTAQAGDNDSYRKCVKELAPYFFKRFSSVSQAHKPNNSNIVQAKPVQKKQVVTTKTPLLLPAENSKNIQTIGTITSKQSTFINEVNGDVNINTPGN